MGVVSAHYESQEVDDEGSDGWHISNMISHHNGLAQWIEDHSFSGWRPEEDDAYLGHGCHGWR
ncbi:MAG: hypothetical protein ABIH11_03680 [Candidatus Altiarchaeota archaeon]